MSDLSSHLHTYIRIPLPRPPLSKSKGQTVLSHRLSESLDSPVIAISPPVKSDRFDALFNGSLRDEGPDLLCHFNLPRFLFPFTDLIAQSTRTDHGPP